MIDLSIKTPNLPIVVGVIILAVSIVSLGLINYMYRKIRIAKNRFINRVTKNVFGVGMNSGDIGTLINAAQEISKEPEVKSVSDLTRIYLPKITKDFADFHNTEAVAAVKMFIKEYLDIKYQNKHSFINSNVQPGLETTVNVEPEKSSVNDVLIHKIAIKDYIKTNEYATIFYQASAGYTVNGDKKEERYKIEYTMKLKENGIAEKIMKCDNCGASIDSAEHETCPYCDVRIIRDTRMSWKFTSVTDI